MHGEDRIPRAKGRPQIPLLEALLPSITHLTESISNLPAYKLTTVIKRERSQEVSLDLTGGILLFS